MYIYIHSYVYMHIVRIYIYICIYIYMYVYIHTYVYIVRIYIYSRSVRYYAIKPHDPLAAPQLPGLPVPPGRGGPKRPTHWQRPKKGVLFDMMVTMI